MNFNKTKRRFAKLLLLAQTPNNFSGNKFEVVLLFGRFIKKKDPVGKGKSRQYSKKNLGLNENRYFANEFKVVIIEPANYTSAIYFFHVLEANISLGEERQWKQISINEFVKFATKKESEISQIVTDIFELIDANIIWRQVVFDGH